MLKKSLFARLGSPFQFHVVSVNIDWYLRRVVTLFIKKKRQSSLGFMLITRICRKYPYMQSLIRTVVFFVLFGVGSGSIALSALCDDLVLYFKNKQALAVLAQETNSIADLVEIHDGLLRQIEEDPNMIKRIAPAVLGTPPMDPNATYPLTGLRELAVARETLQNVKTKPHPIPKVPLWLLRCSEPGRRRSLFLSGSVLVLISFVCFGLRKKPAVRRDIA